MPKLTITYVLATTTTPKMRYPAPAIAQPFLNETTSGATSAHEWSAGPLRSPAAAAAAAPAGGGTLTTMTFDDVIQTKGKTTNGRTIERMTWETTRRVSMPDRPTAMATIIDGTIPISRVTSRRTRGDVRHSMKPSGTAPARQPRRPIILADRDRRRTFTDDLAGQGARDAGRLAATEKGDSKEESRPVAEVLPDQPMGRKEVGLGRVWILVEGGRRDDEDRRVDGDGKTDERKDNVDRRMADVLADKVEPVEFDLVVVFVVADCFGLRRGWPGRRWVGRARQARHDVDVARFLLGWLHNREGTGGILEVP